MLLLSMLEGWCACDSYTDVHKEFIRDGEKKYAPALDSAVVLPGNGRVVLRSWLYNATFVESLHIYWNNNADSLITPVSLKSGLDSVDTEIPNLPENSYSFELFTKDKYGNKSLKSSIIGNSYGEQFIHSYNRRTIKYAVVNPPDTGYIYWNSADERTLFSEVKLTDPDGIESILKVKPDQLTLKYEQYSPGTLFAERSLFLPEANAVDTFYTAWSTPMQFANTLSRDGWSVIFVTTEIAPYLASTVLDGDRNSFWHSNWNSPPALPFDMIIDMNKRHELSVIDIYRRSNNSDTKSFAVYIGEVTDEWQFGGNFTFGSGDLLKAVLTEKLTGRYLKLSFTASNKWDNSMSVAEIYPIGTTLDE